MTFLLDTDAVSEGMKRNAATQVARWLGSLSLARAYISVVTLAEIRSGIDRLPDGARRRELDAWLTNDVAERFRDQVLLIDQPVADVCGRLLAQRHLDRGAVVTMDLWIAATAIFHGLTVVTRNTRDFEALGVPLVNPWLEQA